MWNEKYPELARETQLIMKVTETGHEQVLEKVTHNSYVDWRLLPVNRRDAKKYDLPTLQSLYYYAHCFLLPTCGEGFGLTLAEAMATGLPCIYTPWSGPEDFISKEEGYPVDYEMQDLKLFDYNGNFAAWTQCADPIVESIVDKMHHVYTNYEEAVKKGYLARKRIEAYTWENSAIRFLELLGGVQ
jgi:glycosyltransferase involved in cell wall biosynthesis